MGAVVQVLQIGALVSCGVEGERWRKRMVSIKVWVSGNITEGMFPSRGACKS